MFHSISPVSKSLYISRSVRYLPLLKQPSIEYVVFSDSKFIFKFKSKNVWFSHLFRNCLVRKMQCTENIFFNLFCKRKHEKKLISKLACFRNCQYCQLAQNKPRYIMTLTSIERKKWEHYKEVGLKRTTW